MTSSARLAAAVICMSAVVACSRTERTVVQPAPAPATVVNSSTGRKRGYNSARVDNCIHHSLRRGAARTTPKLP